jgi:hypothetical protein
MFRPIGIRRPFALAAVLALLLPAVAFAQCEIIGDANLCNGAVQLCGPEGLYEYMWIDPAGQFLFDRCIMATTAGTYMLRLTDQFGQSYGPCSKNVEATPPPPCVISGPNSACQGGVARLCGPDGPFTYGWSGPSGFASSAACIDASVEGTYHLSVWSSGTNCPPSTCDQAVTFAPCDTGPPSPPPPPPPDAPPNCPRPAWFWLRQCKVSEHAENRLDSQVFAQVAAAVDADAAIFSWSDARDGFCSVLHGRPEGLRANAKRQFAAVHANVCAGDLGIVGPGGRMIKLDRSTPFNMRGISTTVGDWLAATDARLAQLDGLTRPQPRCARRVPQDHHRGLAHEPRLRHRQGVRQPVDRRRSRGGRGLRGRSRGAARGGAGGRRDRGCAGARAGDAQSVLGGDHGHRSW